MRLGIFGGTFDPIHYGHLILAEICREECHLDEVWFVPSGNPPHKPDQHICEDEQRAVMVELAIAGHPDFKVSRMEFEKQTPTYTVETLGIITSEFPTRELFFLMGSDSLRDLPTWKDPEGIVKLAQLVVVNRNDQAPLTIHDALSDAVRKRIQCVDIPDIDISASELRNRIRQTKSIRYQVPRAVEEYINAHQLYRN